MLPKWLVSGLGVALIVFVALLAVDKAYSLQQLVLHTNPKNTISVSAEGKVQSVPDTATVSLGVITQGVTASGVEEESTKKINKIIDFVKQQGVPKEDVATTQFQINPQNKYDNGATTIVGFEATQTVTVKVKGVDKSTDTLGKILGGAVDNGANQIYGVSFSFNDPDQLRQNARKLALDNAKQKAQELAKAAGVSLGRVISFSESGGGVPPIYYAQDAGYGRGGLSPDSKVAPTVETGSQDIVADMTVIFEIK